MPPAVAAAVDARRTDVAGGVLVVALALWTAFVAGGGEGRSAPILWLLAGLTVAVAAGRRVARATDLLPGAVAAAAAGAIAITYPGLMRAAGAPTGYANANATLAAVGAIAAAGAAQRAEPGPARQAWTALAVALAVATAATGSVAGTLVLAVASALLVVAALVRWPAVAIAGGAVAVSLALGITASAAVDDDPWLASSDVVRVELWSGAAELIGERPATGLGGGAFAERNPVTDDTDLRWAHHEYLELAVELGAIGLLLAIALGLWAYLRLMVTAKTRPAPAALAAAALTVVALHGTVDHIWHAPAVLLLTALLVGDATSDRIEHQTPATLRGRRRGRLGPMVH